MKTAIIIINQAGKPSERKFMSKVKSWFIRVTEMQVISYQVTAKDPDEAKRLVDDVRVSGNEHIDVEKLGVVDRQENPVEEWESYPDLWGRKEDK